MEAKSDGLPPDTALAMNNLANSHMALGRYADAEALHRRVAARREKAFGPTHPDVATSLSNIGTALTRQGRRTGPKIISGARWRSGRKRWASSTPMWR